MYSPRGRRSSGSVTSGNAYVRTTETTRQAARPGPRRCSRCRTSTACSSGEWRSTRGSSPPSLTRRCCDLSEARILGPLRPWGAVGLGRRSREGCDHGFLRPKRAPLSNARPVSWPGRRRRRGRPDCGDPSGRDRATRRQGVGRRSGRSRRRGSPHLAAAGRSARPPRCGPDGRRAAAQRIRDTDRGDPDLGRAQADPDPRRCQGPRPRGDPLGGRPGNGPHPVACRRLRSEPRRTAGAARAPR